MKAFKLRNFFTWWYAFPRPEDIPSSPKASLAAVETEEQMPAREHLEGKLQVQKSPEPEILSTQEDLFDQSNKTGTKYDELLQLISRWLDFYYFCSEATV